MSYQKIAAAVYRQQVARDFVDALMYKKAQQTQQQGQQQRPLQFGEASQAEKQTIDDNKAREAQFRKTRPQTNRQVYNRGFVSGIRRNLVPATQQQPQRQRPVAGRPTR